MGSSLSLLIASAAMLGFVAESSSSVAVLGSESGAGSAVEEGQRCGKGDVAVASISLSGKKHDSFTITLTCGDTEVTSCTATVKSGDMGQCSSQAVAPNDEAMACIVTPGALNSSGASVFAKSCY